MSKIKNLFGLILYKIAPIKKNRYLFTSFNGHYSDNTKAISEKLHLLSNNAEIIWLVEKKYIKDLPSYVKGVDINSLKGFWFRGTATAQIDNVYGFCANYLTSDSKKAKRKARLLTFLQSKKKQSIYTTMHGTPLKRIGRDQVGNIVYDLYTKNTSLLVGDEFSAKIFKGVTFGKMPISVVGSPRNDLLFDKSNNYKEELGLPSDKKIILYAPTFRNDGKDVEGKNVKRSGIDQLNAMDFDLLFNTLKEKFGGEWVMVLRFHYHVANLVDWDRLNNKYPGKFINGNLFDDMALYLAACDLLVSDSSSCMFDYLNTKRPCFIFFPDLDNYQNNERGFYLDIETLPFDVAKDFSTFIKNVKGFDNSKYQEKIIQFKERIGDKNDGKASDRIVKVILTK